MKKEKKILKNKELLAHFNESFADKYTCWSDLYARLRGISEAFLAEPSPVGAVATVATLTAFVIALEELPEEGDVVAIARRLNEILCCRPEEIGVAFIAEEIDQPAGAENVTTASGATQTIPSDIALAILEAFEPPASGRAN